jgi:hypothetical protein
MDEETIKALRAIGEQAQALADTIDVPYPPVPAGFQREIPTNMRTGLERPHPDPLLGEIRGKLNGVATSINAYLRSQGL